MNVDVPPKVAEMAPPDLAEQSEKRIFVVSVFPPTIESVPFSPKSTERAPPLPLADEHEVKEVRSLSEEVMLSVCSPVNTAWMTAPSPSERLMWSKWQLVRVAEERDPDRERREEEREEEVSPSTGSTVMLVRMAVPAVALRRGDVDESSLKEMKERVKEEDGSELEWAEEGAERRKRASPVVSVPTLFVGMFDGSPVMMMEDAEGMDVCVVSAVLCEPV